MADRLVTDEELGAMADAIRARSGTSDPILFSSGSGFADAISGIQLQDGEVTTPKIADGAVTAIKLGSDVDLGIPTTEKGAANGVAELDSTGKVPSAQLPSATIPDNSITYPKLAPSVQRGVVNQNLLRNAYFVGGGTGYGVFPVNQRGASSYSGKVYGIDGWKGHASASAISLGANGVTFTTQIKQVLPEEIKGKDVTTSVLLTNGNLYTKSGTAPTSGTAMILNLGGTAQCYLYADSTSIVLMVENGPEVAAMQLEYGDVSTMCHNEGTENSPVWVMNKIPRYDEELRRCQEWYYEFNLSGSTYLPVAFGPAASSSAIYPWAYLPVTMKAKPIIARIDGTFCLEYGSGSVSVNNTNVSINHWYGSCITFAITASGLTSNRFYKFQGDNAVCHLGLSCEP